LAGEQDVLYEIQAALHRIRSGSYGLCEVTGEPIAKARLRAIPWTRFCQGVEERLENDGTLRTPHLGELRSLNHVVRRSADAEIPDEAEEAL
jgi:RNA polymerase-binding transcription factor DksA